jgi:membrane-associated phospholipid phosphatase
MVVGITRQFRPSMLVARLRRLPGAAITVIVVAYLLAATLFMVWQGVGVTPDYLVGLFLLSALAVGRTRLFLKDWIPFLLLFLGYEFLRGFAQRAGLPVHYGDVIALERALFLGHIPTLVLQHAFFHPPAVHWYDYAGTLTYYLHFAYPLTIGYLLWLHQRPLFLRYAVALLAMSYVAFVAYVLLPVAPPWLAAQHGFLPPVAKIQDFTLPSYLSPIYYAVNANRVAAMPSLHAAFPLLGYLFARRILRGWAWPLFVYTLVVWLSVVYLGEHYVLDVIGGALFALASYAVALRVAPLRPSRLVVARLPSEVATGTPSLNGWRRPAPEPERPAAQPRQSLIDRD